MGIAAGKAAADIDGVDQNAGRDDQLADLPDGLAEGGRNDRLRADMEGKAEPRGDLAGAQKERRRLLARCPELAFERDETVRVGTGDAQVERQVLGPAGLGYDLVELVFAVESKAPDAELAIGPRDRPARLDRIHKEQLGAGNPGHEFDLD